MSGGCSGGVWLDRQAHPVTHVRSRLTAACGQVQCAYGLPSAREHRQNAPHPGCRAFDHPCRHEHVYASPACDRRNGQHVTRYVCPGRWEVRPACCRPWPAANTSASQARLGAPGNVGAEFYEVARRLLNARGRGGWTYLPPVPRGRHGPAQDRINLHFGTGSLVRAGRHSHARWGSGGTRSLHGR